MEQFKISQAGSNIHIDGFPEAEKLIRIEGHHTRRLSSFALHKVDLEFAQECLVAIDLSPANPSVIREALWRSAIVHVFKCFGDAKSRQPLSANKILKGEPAAAQVVFNYFKALRNKHLIHDENPYSQCPTGAVLNKRNNSRKIEKIICLPLTAGTFSQDSRRNLDLLIQKSLSFIVTEFDKLCETLMKELEAKTYDELYVKEQLSSIVPTAAEVGNNRNATLNGRASCLSACVGFRID